jgi:hypothetical protein
MERDSSELILLRQDLILKTETYEDIFELNRVTVMDMKGIYREVYTAYHNQSFLWITSYPNYALSKFLTEINNFIARGEKT